ncbi:Stk1 family PASTA domain-containing Ser/Thr kinase [Actinopolymorpha alba]|uniref:Stk1 family PASTA domain-containing Ser/Thr kinase n=1 Tax=Actinopolymorpha alba TaxID=533267 RepID=UPI00038061F9|nr:Stk1 family PASTA domain-containing Ser/Thr kinase [Actinopolymorpha alba]
MSPSHRTESGSPSNPEGIVGARLLGGRYALGEELGRGGMAVVWTGTDQRLGRTVAVKTLRTEVATDQTVQARFRREAQSVAALNHPSVVAVYDTGEEVLDGVSVPYIVMEYVEGRTLRDVLGEGPRMPPDRALAIVGDVLDALEYSHRAGIIHRDIKPANVMLIPAGKAKVMDFGIARAMADASAKLTQTAAVVGTAQYLSPEQARSEPVDARSDIYSTGCLLYELLTGRPPFLGDPLSVVYQHVQEEPQPPSTLEPQVSTEAERITLTALRKDPLDRYQSASQMRADIDRALTGQSVATAPQPQEATTTPNAPTGTMPPPTVTMPPPTHDGPQRGGAEPHHGRNRRQMRWYALAVVLLVALGAAAVAGYRMFKTDTVAVPRLIGTTTVQAKVALDAHQLELGKTTKTASEEVPKGQIIAQYPAPARSAALGSAVDVTVSTGKPEVRIPEVLGRQVARARATLETAGFRVRDREDTNSRKPEGVVTRVDPPGGSVVPKGSLVTLYHSTGLIKVPDVQYKDEAEAQAILMAAGFKVNKIPQENADADPGTVTVQIPEPGTRRSPGTNVSIVIARKPKPTPTPQHTPTPTPSPSPTDPGLPPLPLPLPLPF